MKALPHTRTIDHQIATCINTDMDLRDWFAGLAMQGILANPQFNVHRDVSIDAYYMADVMIEARKKE